MSCYIKQLVYLKYNTIDVFVTSVESSQYKVLRKERTRFKTRGTILLKTNTHTNQKIPE